MVITPNPGVWSLCSKGVGFCSGRMIFIAEAAVTCKQGVNDVDSWQIIMIMTLRGPRVSLRVQLDLNVHAPPSKVLMVQITDITLRVCVAISPAETERRWPDYR